MLQSATSSCDVPVTSSHLQHGLRTTESSNNFKADSVALNHSKCVPHDPTSIPSPNPYSMTDKKKHYLLSSTRNFKRKNFINDLTSSNSSKKRKTAQKLFQAYG